MVFYLLLLAGAALTMTRGIWPLAGWKIPGRSRGQPPQNSGGSGLPDIIWDNMLEYRKRFRGRPAEEYNMPYNPNPRTSQVNATDFLFSKKDWGEAWQKNWRNVALRTWPDILDRNLRVQATNWNNLHMPERNFSSLSNWSG